MRTTNLKQATTGVIITVLLALVLLSFLRTRLGHRADMSHTIGSALFTEKGCTMCHYTDREDTKIGPGLKGLFGRDKLPISRRSTNEDNVRKQLEEPYKNMPSLGDQLTAKEEDILIEYLKTL